MNSSIFGYNEDFSKDFSKVANSLSHWLRGISTQKIFQHIFFNHNFKKEKRNLEKLEKTKIYIYILRKGMRDEWIIFTQQN